jgi:uncharacterized protein
MEGEKGTCRSGEGVKKPLRKCVVCDLFKSKPELIRLALVKEGEIVVDNSGRSGGKGIYICREGNCREEFLKGKKCRRRFHSKMNALELARLEVTRTGRPGSQDPGGNGVK